MNYLKKLYDTYQANQSQVGIKMERNKDTFVLVPAFHGYKESDLQVHISPTGDFLYATIAKESIVFPATEESLGRTGISAPPHALHDTLTYVAGDFGTYLKPTDANKIKNKHTDYLDNLLQWATGIYGHAKLQSIHTYLAKGTLTKDLIDEGILTLDETGILQSKQEYLKKELTKIFVRFHVSADMDHASEDDFTPIWENRLFYGLYESHALSKQTGQKGLCTVSGNMTQLMKNHPKTINLHAANAKLISSGSNFLIQNDGMFPRFTDEKREEQAAGISVDVSLKAHNALSWLIRKQGIKSGDGKQVTLIWKNKDIEVYNPLNGIKEILEDQEVDTDTYEVYATRLQEALKGKLITNTNESETINFLSLNSVVDGRMHVLNYGEYTEKEYFESIEKWNQTCFWKLKGRNGDYYYGAPSAYEIAWAILKEKNLPTLNEKKLSLVFEDVFSYIFDGKNIHKNYIQQVFRNLYNFGKSEDENEWEKRLLIGCAMFNRFYKKEKYTVALNQTNTNRDYLFGRLLAIADKLEKDYYFQSNMKPRTTNAMKYMANYQLKPIDSWKTIFLKLSPYLEKSSFKGRYDKLIDEVMDLFQEDEFNNNSLTPVFLLGFSNQRNDFYKKNKKELLLEELPQ